MCIWCCELLGCQKHKSVKTQETKTQWNGRFSQVFVLCWVTIWCSCILCPEAEVFLYTLYIFIFNLKNSCWKDVRIQGERKWSKCSALMLQCCDDMPESNNRGKRSNIMWGHTPLIWGVNSFENKKKKITFEASDMSMKEKKNMFSCCFLSCWSCLSFLQLQSKKHIKMYLKNTKSCVIQ